MKKFVCIHGHFYQPPREDPWTRVVMEEASARPYHDWNERITAECYAPNTASPLVGDDGKYSEIVNNYAWMSFDFGPTLLRWLEARSSEVYGLVLDADRQSSIRLGGHGPAMSQVYNHMIMPLANSEDRRTQVAWGIEDFQRRFGRSPEGMWLPETAVDLPTLDSLAEAGIRFTILSPHQASAVRDFGRGRWTDVSGGRIDTRRAYYCTLPSGRSISLFFFDRGISTALAFGDLLQSGTSFSGALSGAFSSSEAPQLVNVASDGETYGHHHKNGQLALTSCISALQKGGIAVTTYGHFLSLAPPTEEVRIIERSSWSCAHGVERWRSNCGCASEIVQGYSQEWRSPLRAALDWLRDRLSEVYSTTAPPLFKDFRRARDCLPSVRFDQRDGMQAYLTEVLKPGTTPAEVSRGRDLLEMVECSALMYASCAWFWEDLTRMETIQMLKFAARAMELASDVSGPRLVPEFRRRLAAAVPNDRRFKDGAQVYEELVGPRSIT